ncbi:MAG: hydroxymethylbilane synthase [Micavibrio sp.]|nr:hydroxymethylbilane synthase [Micavibrio sp.]
MYDFERPLKIGIRGSVLAQTQTQLVVDKLQEKFPNLNVEIVIIKTSGDWKKSQGEIRLSEVEGGKGLFIKEIEHNIIEGTIDCGVHSMKDVPTFLLPNMGVDHVIERGSPYDAFVSNKYKSIEELPKGAVIGTASTRRQAILKHMRPDLQTTIIRGNIDTRLAKLDEGQADALILAVTGLERIQRDHRIAKIFTMEEMLPACGQGTLSIETKKDDVAVRSLFDAIHHRATGLCTVAERSALEALDGSCQTPIGCFATLNGHEMTLRCAVYEEDGSKHYYEETTATITTTKQAHDLGFALGSKIKPRAPKTLFA